MPEELHDRELLVLEVRRKLLRAFPNSRSDNDLAEMAAPFFDVGPRTIWYWLRGDTLPDYGNGKILDYLAGPDDETWP